MSDIVPRSQVSRQGIVGVVASGGGIALLVMAGGHVLGMIVGGALLVIGLALSSSKSDRTAGVLAAVVGAAALAAGILRLSFIEWLMRAAGIVLIGTGVYSLFKFFRNLRKRA